jgi:hypothetical protein
MRSVSCTIHLAQPFLSAFLSHVILADRHCPFCSSVKSLLSELKVSDAKVLELDEIGVCLCVYLFVCWGHMWWFNGLNYATDCACLNDTSMLASMIYL